MPQVQTITLVDEQRIRALQSAKPQSGMPQYAAIRPKARAMTAGQTWEVVFYPVPDKFYFLEYRYLIEPAPLTETNLYPQGGIGISQVFLAACMAEVNKEKYEAAFQAQLKQAIEFDMKSQGALADIQLVETDSTTFGATYSSLRSDVGGVMAFGSNFYSWTHEQASVADQILSDGMLLFYRPPAVGGLRPHAWRFLHPTTTLATVADTWQYDMPSTFGSMEGTMTFDPDEGWAEIVMVGENKIRELRQSSSATSSGIPRFGAIRPKSTVAGTLQEYELLLFPTPDDAYTLTYRYMAVPARLSASNPYPLGGDIHADTVRAACLAAAELHKDKAQGPLYKAFLDRLAASIAHDLRVSGESLLGYNGDGSDKEHQQVRVSRSDYITFNGVLYTGD